MKNSQQPFHPFQGFHLFQGGPGGMKNPASPMRKDPMNQEHSEPMRSSERKLSARDRELIWSMRADGWTPYGIADRLGIPERAVNQIIRPLRVVEQAKAS